MTLYPNDISFPVSGNNYYCAGNLSNRGIAYSSNGGANWTPIDRIELGGVNLNELQFTSVNSGFALGSNTYLYNTTNGGFNWNYAGIASVNSFTINGSRGCAVGNNGYIGLSSNGGNIRNYKLLRSFILEFRKRNHCRKCRKCSSHNKRRCKLECKNKRYNTDVKKS